MKAPFPTDPTLLAESGRPLIHRDLSWIQFNDRVLHEAMDRTNPLLERFKFLAISATNLDEFFMIRLSSLYRSIAQANRAGEKTEERRLELLLASILAKIRQFNDSQARVFRTLRDEGRAQGIHFVNFKKLSPRDKAFTLGQKLFESVVLPKLETPQEFSLQKLSTLENLQTALVFSENVWFRLPKNLPGALWLKERSEIFIYFIDDLLSAYLGGVFGLKNPPIVYRLTRDGDFTVEVEEDVTSIPEMVRSGLSGREKGRPVRLQTRELASADACANALKIRADQVFLSPITVSLYGLWTALGQLPDEITKRSGLKHSTFTPHLKKPLASPETCFDRVKQGDILFHHPYDAFDSYVHFLQACSRDPKVRSIEQTIYRTENSSPLIDTLKEAAKDKKVRVVIELRARFDELNNLRLAEELRQAGVEVTFGFGKLKLHAKLALVTREEESGLRHYTHLSTGNYHEGTARKYVDLAVLTAHADIGADARTFFDCVAKREIPSSFKTLVPAPTKLHRKLLQHIEAECKAAQQGLPARIIAKVNALVDEGMIDSLYRASQAGVTVDLIVRGACSLIPGVPGLSENIRVISLVDRFLEHSRIYYFKNSEALYFSSADWMPRNFFSRLELAYPIVDPKLFRYIEQFILPTYLSDNMKAWELLPKGQWKQRRPKMMRPRVRAQFAFEEIAKRGYQNSPIE